MGNTKFLQLLLAEGHFQQLTVLYVCTLMQYTSASHKIDSGFFCCILKWQHYACRERISVVLGERRSGSRKGSTGGNRILYYSDVSLKGLKGFVITDTVITI